MLFHSLGSADKTQFVFKQMFCKLKLLKRSVSPKVVSILWPFNLDLSTNFTILVQTDVRDEFKRD